MKQKIRHLVVIEYPSGRKEDHWFDNLIAAQKTRDSINNSNAGKAEIVPWQ